MFMRTIFATTLALASMCSINVQAAVVGVGTSSAVNLYNGNPAQPKAPPLLPTGSGYFPVTGTNEKTPFLINNAELIGLPAGTSVDFSSSESVLTAIELNQYKSSFGATYGNLIQIPIAGTAVAIAYKKSGVSTLQLSGNQLCDIFSGTVSTWGQILGTSDTMPIKVIYRDGSSGSTELLSRFLNDSCANRFSVSSTFTTANMGAEPTYWKAVKSSADVLAAVKESDGAIGYGNADLFTLPPNNATVARVSKLNMAQGAAPLPTVSAIRAGLGWASPLGSSADRMNPLKWVRTFGASSFDTPVPTGGGQYPIVGYINMLVGQCPSAADASVIRKLLADVYTGVSTPSIILNGFVPMPGTAATPTQLAGEIKKVFLDDAYGDGLDIGNVNACNGRGRP